MVKKVTDEELILYLENDLSKSRFNEIKEQLKTNEELKTRFQEFQKIDQNIIDDIESKFQIPDEFRSEVKTLLAKKHTLNRESVKNKFLKLLSNISPISLISGSFVSGVALTSLLITIFTPTLVFRGADTLKLRVDKSSNIFMPKKWSVNKDILYIVMVNNKIYSNKLKGVKIKINSKINFKFVSLRNMKVDIKYLDSNKKVTNLHLNKSLKKGETFSTEELTISKPIGNDKLQIFENDNIIFEQDLHIIN